MKVILLSDIPKIGRKLEVKEVSGGYARNFLFPQRLAELATEGAMASLDVRHKKVEAERKQKLEELGSLFSSLDGKRINISAKANEEGHLFAGIHREEVQKAILDELKIDAPIESIQMERNIKELGEHEITLSAEGKEAKLLIVVERSAE